eukprot:GHVQ01024391.1.p2 GENE.GHVQ01024391.1~~GHVQ01024391.1.p2  ORF type:complete len:612 (+),score=92.33 GHVQ01024391.1:436-2271(+)
MADQHTPTDLPSSDVSSSSSVSSHSSSSSHNLKALVAACDEHSLEPSQSSPCAILRLPEEVINRIAAGEVIVRPSSAVKELLENCLDAKASLISLLVKQGGVKYLQITDDGTGIRKEDLPIVCERFTTSKLRKYEDLGSRDMRTFGFRGEALASITHVAHVTVQSRTRYVTQDDDDGPIEGETKTARCQDSESSLASHGCSEEQTESTVSWLCSYHDGKCISGPKACAGNIGTKITYEDLFYNMPTRLRAVTNATEEYHRLLEVVQMYAVQFPAVKFQVKVYGAKFSDVNTVGDEASATTGGGAKSDSGKRTESEGDKEDRLRLQVITGIYGTTVSRELIPIKFEFPEGGTCQQRKSMYVKCKGLLSNANYSVKRGTFILFINNRLVDCPHLKKGVLSCYAWLLTRNTHPWVYLSLELDPESVDVNVHPSKQQLHFLHQDAIILMLVKKIQESLSECNNSRVFSTRQTTLSCANTAQLLNPHSLHNRMRRKGVTRSDDRRQGDLQLMDRNSGVSGVPGESQEDLRGDEDLADVRVPAEADMPQPAYILVDSTEAKSKIAVRCSYMLPVIRCLYLALKTILYVSLFVSLWSAQSYSCTDRCKAAHDPDIRLD